MIMYYKECECILCPMFLYYCYYYYHYYYYYYYHHHSVLHIRTLYSNNVSEAGFLSEKLFFKPCVLIRQWTQ